MKRFMTSESVTEGHPDKVADQISDALLDAILTQDSKARCAIETIVNTGLVMVFGEVTTSAYVDIQAIVRQKLRDIGYQGRQFGFDADTVAVIVSLDEQSADIAQGVDHALEFREGQVAVLGAGDQGIMFGYACDETEALMPLPIALSHRLAARLAQVRKTGRLPYLGPDGKTQVTIEYNALMQVQRIDNIVISTQHLDGVDLAQIRQDMVEYVIKPVVPQQWLDEATRYLVNPTGKFVIGGPVGDSGLTGRKIIVDTYGGMAHHGGGAFSGKDPTKVDRSGSYMARYLAKNIVAAGLASRCEIQLAYAIGVAEPTSIMIETFGTGQVSEERLIAAVRKTVDLHPGGIIAALDLQRPIYSPTAAYGHFGRLDIALPWEKIDLVERLKTALADESVQ